MPEADIAVLADFACGDTLVRYVREGARVGLELLPVALAKDLPAHRESGLPGHTWIRGRRPDSLVQLKLVGDAYPGGFAPGRSMRESASVAKLTYVEQRVARPEGGLEVITVLAHPSGLRCEHRLAWRAGTGAIEVTTTAANTGAAPVQLELLTSFSLGGISPFVADDAPLRLRAHRFRSAWSAEGRHESVPFEDLHLERSWTGHCALAERFGQVGSMPVRGFFPFAAIEDTGAGVLWGATLACPGSWELEFHRRDDHACLSGGQADRELGHWMRRLAPGESFTGPAATLACVHGGIDDLCARLLEPHVAPVERQPAIEASLPIVCNEYCTTWGNPSEDRLLAIADRLKGTAVKFLVIDAGWYRPEDGDWGNSHGDWIPSRVLFPQGIAATAAKIRERGLIPGLWFEFETMGPKSQAWQETAHQLRRDGIPIESGGRRFWDMADPWVHDYLGERVIARLRDGGFGYLKVDYNECIGLGADHRDSLGEGLRASLEGSQRFFARLRRELPDLVIENCSSGGHRLERSFMGLAAQASFSDAHELVEIPIVAAALQRLILPRQSQIWAVLKQADAPQRLAYSLAATFLGRMAISGDLVQLAPERWQLVEQAMALYGRAAPVIRDGTTRLHGATGPSWRHPQGWQASVRTARDGRSALVVAHSFADAPGGAVIAPLPAGRWRVADGFNASREDTRVDGQGLSLRMPPWTGRVVVCEREG